MEQEFFPPLPDPAENQPPEARRAMGQRLIKQARYELDSGDRLQAGGKAWGAAIQYLKIIGEQRGWGHESNRQLESLGKHLAAEFPENGSQIATALADAYFKGHENFYENRRRLRDVREAVEGVEEIMPILERLTEEPPRPFTIASNSQVRRLRVLTGRDDLHVGDSSEVGFSLRTEYGRGGTSPTVAREEASLYEERLQPIVRNLMRTLLEDYPSLLDDDDIRNFQDASYCRDILGLTLGGFELLRSLSEGKDVNGHARYWAKIYGGRYYVCNNWWKAHHLTNAKALQALVSAIIHRSEGHPGIPTLQNHWRELNEYIGSNQ